jgi:vitamin B12 transporter
MSKKLTLLSTALLTATALLAQQDTLTTKSLDEVIVTANKVAQKQSQTGKVVTVITKEQLEKSAGKTVAQVLNEQVGITINGSLNNLGTNQSLYVRGAGNGRALILLDGIPVNDPSQISNDYDLNLFSINDVERIEICKGAQSTLYGSDAVAGVINIITVKSDISKTFNLKASISAGNRNTNKQSLQLYGKAGKFIYTTRFSKLKTDGFSTAYDSSANGKNFDKDGYDGTATNGSLLYQATKDFSVKAFTQYSQYTAGIDAGAFADKRNFTTFSKSHISGLGLNLKKDRYTVVGNYQYTKANRVIDDNENIPGATNYALNVFTATAQFAELYTSVKLAKGFTLLAGGDYRYASFFSKYTSQSSFGPYNSAFPDTAMNQVAAYTSLAYNSKHFNIEFGGRYNKHSRYGDNYTYTFNPSYTIDDNYRIFGSIATGFKAPSLYQLYGDFVGNKNLKPERSINYEIGVQQQVANFKNRVVFFYRDITDGIDYSNITTNSFPAGTGYFNYASQVVRGLEYEISINPTKHLTITGNYTFLAGEELTQSRFNFKDTAYNYLLRRPKHNLNITAGYQFTKGLYLSVSGKYISARQDVGGYKKADIGLDSYFIVGAYADYTLNATIKFFADAQNLTNKKFYDIRGFNSQPLLFNAGVTINW